MMPSDLDYFGDPAYFFRSMSEMTSDTSIVTSVSDGEISQDKHKVVKTSDSGASFCTSTVAESKLKRTFNLTRNVLTGTRISKRKIKHKQPFSLFSGFQESNPVIDENNKNTENENLRNQATTKNNQKQTGSLLCGFPENCSVIDENMKNSENGGHKLFRAPSWNKFVSKLLQRVSSHINNQKTNLCTSYEYGIRRKSPASLSSNDLRVPPPRPSVFANGDKVPGVIGLRNHGNTCFINAVLQCLSHTDILAEYFVLDQYKIDLSRRNKLNSKKYGTKGEVTEQLALLLKAIWSCQYDPEISNKFKTIVDKYASQYRGNNQHDAQEFLLWLLDKVHEDLNTATKKKYKMIKNSFGRPDDVVAAETLANHVRCNSSFVHAVFQAQFRSSLTCPRCKRQSNTFDPFLCVSVPVPQNQFRPLYVTVVYTSQQPRQVKIGLSLPSQTDVHELRTLLSSDTAVSEENMLLLEINDLGFHNTFIDSMSINDIKESDKLYCMELPQLKEVPQEATSYLLLCWVNVLVVEDECSRFGSPFTMQICRETSYTDLQKLLLKEMSWMLHDDVLTTEQDVPLFRIRLASHPEPDAYLDPTLDHPLYSEFIDHVLNLCEANTEPAHIKLVLEWDLQSKESTIADDSDQVEEHNSVSKLKSMPESGGSVSLEECFQLYTRAEVLAAEDAWHCPHCDLKQEVVKELGLWSLPDILVVHLKRFKQTAGGKPPVTTRPPIKLTTLVDFPLYGFDMTPHLAGGHCTSPTPALWSSWKRPKHSYRHDDNVYDLYAVCNHHGDDLQGGHYTAYCRNPYDAQWYCFDDARVTQVQETDLLTPSAYILFYQRRGLITSSSSSSTGSSGGEHWAARLPSVVMEQSKSTEDLREGKKDFPRNDRAYATLQPQSKRTSIDVESSNNHSNSTKSIPSAVTDGKQNW